MNKKKGFTLIELLAVIVIITIIALITIPVVFSAIDGARAGAIRSSAYGYINAIDFYASTSYNDDNPANDVNWDAPFNWNTNKDNIDSKGRQPSAVNVTLENGKVDDGTMVFDDYLVTIENGKVISVDMNDGSVVTGPFVYVDRPITYEWEDATTKIVFSDTDESYTSLNLPFNIQINSDTFDTIYVQTNGVVSLVDSLFTYENLPVVALNDPAFAVLWMDLDVEPTGTSGVFYKYGNEDSKDYVLIEYRDVVEWGLNNPISFEIKIYSDGTVKMSYKEVNNADNGEFASIGIYINNQNYDFYSFLQNILVNNSTIIYELIGTELDIPEEPPVEEILCFTFDSSTGTVTGYEYKPGCTTDIVIPSSVNGVAVTTIGNYAFYSGDITSITLPNSITTIEEYAFASSQLTSINIPSSVTTIGNNAFDYGVLTNLELGNGVLNIGNNAFAHNQLTSIIIPSSVSTIGQYAFTDNQLVNLTIPNNVTTIGEQAFSENLLTSVTLGTGINEISAGLFVLNNLETISIPSNITKIGEYAFQNNDLTSITIPNSVIEIGVSAFSYNLISSATISDNIEIIPIGLFKNNQLTSIEIPDNINAIETSAFENNQLATVVIPDGVLRLDPWAFKNNMLTSVLIGNSVTIIDTEAFMNNRLTSITIPNSVTTISTRAFSTNNINSINIGNGVTSIYNEAFRYNDLSNITIPDNVITIRNLAFANNLLTNVDIGSGVMTIMAEAFRYNNILQGSAIIRKSSGTVSVLPYAFNNNGADGATTITPTYIP